MKRIGLITTTLHASISEKTATPIVKPQFTHCAIVGRTGSGKTTGAILPNIAERIRLGHGVLVYDFKGNLHPQVKKLAYDHGRDMVVSLGQPWSPRINLIDGMTMKELSNMFEASSGMDKGNDGFWISQGKEVILPVIALFRYVRKTKEALAEWDMDCDFEIEYRGKSYRFDRTPSLKAVRDAMPTLQAMALFFEAATVFAKEIEGLYIKERFFEIELPNFQRTFQRLLEHLALFEDLSERFPADERDYRTNASIHTTALSMLEGLADNPAFNEDEFDVAEYLERGGVVVIDLQELTDTQIAYFTRTLFARFHGRFLHREATPVSIFIDEAQRVLVPGMDLPLDTMREARVDLFLAFQNAQVLQKKIGHDAFYALFGNLTSKILFASDLPFDGVDTSSLEPFGYVRREEDYQNVYMAEPLFVSEKEAFEAEWRYQKARKVRQMYRLELTEPMRQKYIFVYEPKIFQDGLLTLKTLSGARVRAPFVEADAMRKLQSFLAKMKSKAQAIERSVKTLEEVEKVTWPAKRPKRLKKRDPEDMVGEAIDQIIQDLEKKCDDSAA